MSTITLSKRQEILQYKAIRGTQQAVEFSAVEFSSKKALAIIENVMEIHRLFGDGPSR